MTYRLIYADPAWSYSDKRIGRGGAEGHYSTATLAQIGCHIEALADPAGCVLACWQTWPMETAQDGLLLGMGWKKIGLLFIWHKLTSTGKEFVGCGLAGTRANTEPCFLWRRGKDYPRRVDNMVREYIGAPVAEHSRKPDEARIRLERLYGDVPRVEMYRRGAPPAGWDAWGNEVEAA